MIRILIADDHLLFREGLKQVLAADPRMQVVAEASTSSEMVAEARRAKPEVVLLDISMPGRGGLEGVEDLKRWNPGVRVLMLTAHPEDHYAVRCLKAGADGYMTKDHAPADLVEAILRIHRGRKYISPLLAESLAVAVTSGAEGRPHERLSDRELQVLEQIAVGRTITEIGAALHLSVKTVSTYRSRILEKMELHSTAEIVRYAIKEGLVE